MLTFNRTNEKRYGYKYLNFNSLNDIDKSGEHIVLLTNYLGFWENGHSWINGVPVMNE